MSKNIANPRRLTSSKRSTKASICGIILIVLSLSNLIFWKNIFNTILEQTMVLSEDSKSFQLWKTPPIILTLDFYLFNWTNPEDFYKANIKPKLQQLGPYRFIEIPDKVDIHWHPHNASVTYRRRSQFHFDAAGSTGSLDDKVVTINSLAVAMGRTTKKWNLFARGVFNAAIRSYKISITKTADELLWGYEDSILDIANFIPPSLLDFSVPYDKYGYCYGRNDSADFYGEINIHTGADDIQKIGQIHTWRQSNKTSAQRSGCNMVRGSMGEFQTPHLKENVSIEYFLPDLCRPMEMEFEKKVFVEGVEAYKYVGGSKAVDNGTKYPENECFCNGECVPSGLINVSSCWYDSPIFMSYPHFYKADPSYVEQVEGLNPKKDKHELYLTLEPETGYAVDVGARLQANILVEPLAYLDMFRGCRKIFFPLFWIEERTRITPDLAKELKLLPMLIVGGRLIGWLGLILGLVLCAWKSARLCCGQQIEQPLEINDFDRERVDSMKSSKNSNIFIIGAQNSDNNADNGKR